MTAYVRPRYVISTPSGSVMSRLEFDAGIVAAFSGGVFTGLSSETPYAGNRACVSGEPRRTRGTPEAAEGFAKRTRVTQAGNSHGLPLDDLDSHATSLHAARCWAAAARGQWRLKYCTARS